MKVCFFLTVVAVVCSESFAARYFPPGPKVPTVKKILFTGDALHLDTGIVCTSFKAVSIGRPRHLELLVLQCKENICMPKYRDCGVEKRMSVSCEGGQIQIGLYYLSPKDSGIYEISKTFKPQEIPFPFVLKLLELYVLDPFSDKNVTFFCRKFSEHWEIGCHTREWEKYGLSTSVNYGTGPQHREKTLLPKDFSYIKDFQRIPAHPLSKFPYTEYDDPRQIKIYCWIKQQDGFQTVPGKKDYYTKLLGEICPADSFPPTLPPIVSGTLAPTGGSPTKNNTFVPEYVPSLEPVTTKPTGGSPTKNNTFVPAYVPSLEPVTTKPTGSSPTKNNTLVPAYVPTFEPVPAVAGP